MTLKGINILCGYYGILSHPESLIFGVVIYSNHCSKRIKIYLLVYLQFVSRPNYLLLLQWPHHRECT